MAELEARYVGCRDATALRHFQVIWLLAQGHTVAQVSAPTAFGEPWIEQLLARSNGANRRWPQVLRRKKIEVFATDAHRIGLKPVTRRVWALIGERPIAHGHHRFDWLSVSALVSPASGETFWYVSNGVSKEFFAALRETFAREAEAGLARIILRVRGNAAAQSLPKRLRR